MKITKIDHIKQIATISNEGWWIKYRFSGSEKHDHIIHQFLGWATGGLLTFDEFVKEYASTTDTAFGLLELWQTSLRATKQAGTLGIDITQEYSRYAEKLDNASIV